MSGQIIFFYIPILAFSNLYHLSILGDLGVSLESNTVEMATVYCAMKIMNQSLFLTYPHQEDWTKLKSGPSPSNLCLVALQERMMNLSFTQPTDNWAYGSYQIAKVYELLLTQQKHLCLNLKDKIVKPQSIVSLFARVFALWHPHRVA